MEFTFFGGKYRLEGELADGGCGTVFVGVHTIAGKEVAIKLEPAINARHSPLKQESKVYKTLMGGTGVPWIMWSGKQGNYNVLVIDLLGPSLEDFFKMCNKRFTLKTVLLLADQLISRIEFIHSRDFVHRDVKPANFVMGPASSPSSCHLVNVIDFGLAKKYKDPISGEHIPYRQDDCHGAGTSLFAAINTHSGIESSRRDDLESLSYMLIYFLRGRLPWCRIRNASTTKMWSLILAKKLECEPLLTVGLPEEFDILYRYSRGLGFDNIPDYEGMRRLFRNLGQSIGIDYDDTPKFDWDMIDVKSGMKMGGTAHGGRYCEACNKRQR